ncbi:hypothetical protein COCMIDRAFT_72262, partial [Bipolaris oryzae ATCC 44560]
MDRESLAGAQLVSNDELYQTSTITCGVQFIGNDTVFALTSAHAFEDNDKEESDKRASDPEDSMSDYSSSGSDYVNDYGLSETVGEYDWDEIEIEAAAVRKGQEPSLSCPSEPAPRQKVWEHPSRFKIEPDQVWGRPDDPKWADQPDLDWALVEMPNSCVFDEKWEMIPSDLPKTPTTVVVVTRYGFRKGTSSSIPSYISRSRNSTAWTKVWTIALDEDEQRHLHIGDSGSPVLNVDSDTVYGYVTALNCFGELHMMPIQAVLDQIWDMVQPLEADSKPII